MRFLAFAVALSLMPLTTLTAEKPFDFASTPGKLPKQIVPEEYAVRIVPDIARRTFTGSESVKLNGREAVKQIVLNALEIKISKAAIDGKPIAASAIKLDEKEQTLTLVAELATGSHTLELEFTGKINQQGQGLYYAPYQEQGTGAKKLMLGTQFEATDARRLFPCWDEPSFRARFQLTAVVPENFTAMSNMPVDKETKVAGRKEVRFAATPPMASYLNVFCAGELDAIQTKNGEVMHGVVATKGKAEMGRYALESSQQILEYYNDYFGQPFPLPKLDHIAVPGGFGGAMENWGGITYYESVLLFDPEKSSAQTKQNIYEVLAHETAHMWFGDLVTMAWWDNLWLNEGFASWMGTKCTAKFNPDWEVWLSKTTPRDPMRRSGIGKESAMEGDARSTTHPIQQPIATETEANSAFDDITYRKGMSFIRMLESFLGEDVFRDGIRKYIAAHKLSNSTTTDLWNALAEASGKPVVEIAAAWTQQPGFPIVKVARDASGKITLTQERFTVHFDKPPPLEWKIPLTYEMPGEPATASLLMTSKSMELPNAAAKRAIKLNVEGAGNYRVQYDDASWKLLLPDLRPSVLAVVGRYADEATWNKLHELGLKTTSIEEKQYYYDALACATDPKLAERTLQISLSDELPTSRAVFLVAKVARQSEHPEIAWMFAKAHMKQLLAKADALGANSYAPSLFTFFSDPARIAELERYAKSDLPATAAKAVAKAVDEVGFRAEIKPRLITQIGEWISEASKGH